LRRRHVIFEILAFLLLILSCAPKPIAAQTQIPNSLDLTVYLDGFVQVDQTVEFNQPVLSFNLTLLSKTFQNLLIVDENNLPQEYTINDNIAAIYNVGSTEIAISYLTQDLTTKSGKYWTITTDYPQSKVLIMPKNTSIISVNNVPNLIETVDDSLRLTMPMGLTEVIYTTEHAFVEQNKITTEASGLEGAWPIALAIVLVLIVPASLTWVWLQKRKKTAKPKTKKDEKQDEVDLEKLLSKHRELRQDEKQVIEHLATKNGKAFEAELFELLNLPRTTTWRLIRRLEGLEIVHIKKSRRQNIVLIREKYLKKR
jgi:uncharacterized membrane protein